MPRSKPRGDLAGLCLLCLTGRATDLREKQIDTEWCILVCEEGLELCDLLAQHIWCVSDASNNTETAGICDCCCEFRTGRNVHTSKEYWMRDLEEVGDRCAELLCEVVVSLRCLSGWHVIVLIAWNLRGEAILMVCGLYGYE